MATITLNQLISELTNVKEVNQIIESKYNKNNLNDFFKNIFNDQIYRHGIIQNFKSSTRTLNISLYYSLLFLIDNQFEKLDEFKQIDNINSLVNKMCLDINSNPIITKYNYRELKIKKLDLINDISNYKNTNKVIKFLSDYFDINIFLCNFEHNKLYCVCDNEFYNKYRNNIIIGQINSNSFEPILTDKSKIFPYNHPIINNLLNNHKHYILPLYGNEFIIKSDFDINNDLNFNDSKNKDIENKDVENKDIENKDIENKDIENKDIENIDVENKDIENIDVENKDVENKKVKIKYSLKNKLNELQEIAKTYNIDLNKIINGKEKSKTKSEIITDLDIYFANY